MPLERWAHSWRADERRRRREYFAVAVQRYVQLRYFTVGGLAFWIHFSRAGDRIDSVESGAAAQI